MSSSTDSGSKRKAPLTYREAFSGISVGDTFHLPDDDRSFEHMGWLRPSEAHRNTKELAPGAVLCPSTGVRAQDISESTIQNGSVVRGLWENNMAVVVEKDHAERSVTIIVRRCRAFAMMTKRYPTAGGALELHDLVHC